MPDEVKAGFVSNEEECLNESFLSTVPAGLLVVLDDCIVDGALSDMEGSLAMLLLREDGHLGSDPVASCSAVSVHDCLAPGE